jgi:hypothetical protein
VEAKAGPLALFMLVAPDIDTNDAWNVVVSAQGLDSRSRGNAVRLLSELLRSVVDESHWSQIARTTVLRTDDPFVKSMNQAFHTERQPVSLQSCNVFGFEIPKAIVLASKRIAA